MISALRLLALFAALARVLAVESSTDLKFERKKGSVWCYGDKPIGDLRRINRSALCKDIKSKAKPDEIGSCSISLLCSLATSNSSKQLMDRLGDLSEEQENKVLDCAEAANWPHFGILVEDFGYESQEPKPANPDVVKALEYAHILLGLDSAASMDAYLNLNTDADVERKIVEYAYWLNWVPFEEFADEMDREPDLGKLKLIHDVTEDDTEDSIVEISTSFCSKEDLFFLISLKSAADLEQKLCGIDNQRHFGIFHCANYAMWIHIDTFNHVHKFIVNYRPDPILFALLGDDGPKTALTTTQLKDSPVKHSGIKQVIAERYLNTIDKIAGLYYNNKSLFHELLPLVPSKLVIDLGTCTEKLVSSICIMHHDENLCNRALAMLVEKTSHHFQINITDSRCLRKVLGSSLPKFLIRSQIRVTPKFNANLNDLFDAALTLADPVVINEAAGSILRGIPFKYMRPENLSGFLRAIKIKDLNVEVSNLLDIIEERNEILPVVSTISARLRERDLFSDEGRESLQIIKGLYPPNSTELGEIRINGDINENLMGEFIKSLEWFSGIKVVAIQIYPWSEEKIKNSTRVIQRLGQIYPKIDLLKIWSHGFEFHNAHLTLFNAFPELESLRLGLEDYISPSLKVLLEKAAPKLTRLEIFLHKKIKSVPNGIPRLWPLLTNLTVHMDDFFNTSETVAIILTGLQTPNLKTVTVEMNFGEWSDRRIMTKEECLSMQPFSKLIKAIKK